MRNIIGILAVFIAISCGKEEVKDYAKIEGKVKISNLDKFTIQGKNYSKDVIVNKDGSFSDTLKVEEGVFAISNGNDRVTLFLKNGYNLDLEFKGEKFSNGVTFKGEGSVTNNFIENKRSFYTSDFANPNSYFQLDKEQFEARLSEAKTLLKEYKDNAPNLDSIIVKMDDRNDEMFFGYIESNYERMHESMARLGKGKMSPKFENYENFAGGTTSLDDLKGKYVYIDVWATWCAPCKAEIPHLKSLEKQYHGKNIEFVSISVDKQDAYGAWKQMVKDEELGGIQLYADNNFESKFIAEYGINAIPRFILIDPDGKIVQADAPRPSSPNLKDLFTELGI